METKSKTAGTLNKNPNERIIPEKSGTKKLSFSFNLSKYLKIRKKPRVVGSKINISELATFPSKILIVVKKEKIKVLILALFSLFSNKSCAIR